MAPELKFSRMQSLQRPVQISMPASNGQRYVLYNSQFGELSFILFYDENVLIDKQSLVAIETAGCTEFSDGHDDIISCSTPSSAALNLIPITLF